MDTYSPEMVKIRTQDNIDLCIDQLMQYEIIPTEREDDTELRYILGMLMKIQDRDTRHACAEAVLNSDNPHDTCMNVTSV